MLFGPVGTVGRTKSSSVWHCGPNKEHLFGQRVSFGPTVPNSDMLFGPTVPNSMHGGTGSSHSRLAGGGRREGVGAEGGRQSRGRSAHTGLAGGREGGRRRGRRRRRGAKGGRGSSCRRGPEAGREGGGGKGGERREAAWKAELREGGGGNSPSGGGSRGWLTVPVPGRESPETQPSVPGKETGEREDLMARALREGGEWGV